MTDPQPTRVLVVEDEPVLRGTVVNYLERAGLTCRGIADGLEAVDTARDWQPEVVVLDLGLPGLDGIEVCRRIRTFSDCYVLMLTARAEELDTLVGLSVGADDYMTKPFSARELVARVQVLLRRPRRDAPHAAPTRWVFGDLVVLPDSREALLDGKPVDLTRTEFDLLQALARRPRTVLTRHQLTTEVWGGDRGGDDHLVDVHIANLRRKLGDDPANPRYVTTVRGVGHRMGSGS